jgi:hypothetical protein
MAQISGPLASADNVQEATNTTGIGGALTLTGASGAFSQTFSAGIGSGVQCTYECRDGDGVHWFSAVGTYNAGTLTRDLILDGSNGKGTDVSLSGSTPHTVYLTGVAAFQNNLIGKYITQAGDTGFTFSSIPQIYTDLELTMVGRLAGATTANPFFTINGLSTAIYSNQRMFLNAGVGGPGDQSLLGTSMGSGATFPGTTFLAVSVGLNKFRFFNYTDTSFSKTFEFISRQPNSTTTDNSYHITGSGQINTTAAITSITVGSAQAFLAGSIFTLRGIK